jgi:hypothetical protein
VNKVFFRKEVLPQPARKVVKHGYFVALIQKFPGHMASDITRTADNKYVQFCLPVMKPVQTLVFIAGKVNAARCLTAILILTRNIRKGTR